MSSLNPLTLEKLTLAEEEMKGFKIHTTKEIETRKKAGAKKKRKKVLDISVVDCSIGKAVTPSGSTELSSKTMPSKKRPEWRRVMILCCDFLDQPPPTPMQAFWRALDNLFCFRRMSSI